MADSKYGKILTIVLIVVIIGIVILLGFLGYDYYQRYFTTKDAMEFVDNYDTSDNEEEQKDNVVEENTTTEDVENTLDQIESTPSASGGTSGKVTNTYKGFVTLGTMEIPKIGFGYPVLEKVTPKALEVSVGILYGAGLNQVGNTVIQGHNYRNGLFFSNNKKLSVGDKIYIKDNYGNRVTYTIYNKFEATPEDTSFYVRDTDGKAEITLSTCTDDSSARLIILARQD